MNGDLKTNYEEILTHLKNIKKAEWILNRKWWPKYLFHFTDITNATSILECDALYSRNKALDLRLMKCDNASPDVINKTPREYKDYVRLYFRPRTPTQYHNEGFRLVGAGGLNAHCPIPIIFLFNSEPILIKKDSSFSDGNIASPNVKMGDDTAFFLNLNFQDIYHDMSLFGLDNYDRKRIIYHRQSEVLTKNEIGLNELKYIYCRSRAEYETFKNMLRPEIWKRWSSIVGVDSTGRFFFNRWPYISDVVLNSEYIFIKFNPISKGPYKIQVNVTDMINNVFREWKRDDYYFNGELKLDLSQRGSLESYELRIHIDGHPAYLNYYTKEEIIF